MASSQCSRLSEDAKREISAQISSLFDDFDAKRNTEKEVVAREEAKNKDLAVQATAALPSCYAGFRVVTARESELLRWAKMQVEIRRLQHESGVLLTKLTGFIDPEPPDNILKEF